MGGVNAATGDIRGRGGNEGGEYVVGEVTRGLSWGVLYIASFADWRWQARQKSWSKKNGVRGGVGVWGVFVLVGDGAREGEKG